MVILYPWPKNMIQNMGTKKSSKRKTKEYSKYCSAPVKNGDNLVFKCSINNLRKFYINHLLYHEVGHHVDWYFRHWSKANKRQLEEFADQYAMQKTATETSIFNKVDCV